MESMDNYCLEYTRQLLEKLKIQTVIMTPPYDWNPEYDFNLRSKICKDLDTVMENFRKTVDETYNSAIITSIADSFCCEYIIVKLPTKQTDEKPPFLMVGPFSYEKITLNRIDGIIKENAVPDALTEYMQLYYATLPYVSDDRWMKSTILTLAQNLWKQYEIKAHRYHLEPEMNLCYFDNLEDTSSTVIAVIEKRYEYENQMMQNISNGNLEKVTEAMKNADFPPLNQRFPDTLRDKKNQMIIMNTLCRKAAQNGYVHPMYLDEISRKYAIQIEEATTTAQIDKISVDMQRKYCMLVKSHSLRNYSKPIRDVMNKITLDLTEDLSLSAMALELSLNSSYLSNLFKKETGMTLTAYVNAKRMERSIFLLNTTQHPIQEIASMCGIPDVNYFTKLFKKHMNMTPSEYRNMIQNV